MMTSLLLLAAAQPMAAPQNLTPGQLISKMFARYHGAKSLTGNILLTIDDGRGKVRVETSLGFTEGSKMFVRQAKVDGQKASMFCVSDGRIVIYSRPESLLDQRQVPLSEPVTVGDETKTVQDLYGIAVGVMIDRSLPQDVVFARKTDMEAIIGQLVNYQFDGKAQVGEREGLVVTGTYRSYAEAPPRGLYRMVISEAGDLIQFVLDEQVTTPEGVARLRWTWDVDVKLGVSPPDSAFRLPSTQ
ncbi:MAG: hypothetical protein Fur0036_15140 [Fimbriimonadaceae bacterium]